MLRLAALILAASALSAAAQDEPLLDVAVSEEFGPYLVGRDDRPVYAFVTDVRGGDDITPIVSCQERCLEEWPLVTVEGETVPVSDNVSEFLVETIDWDGENVVVYASKALFYYFRDEPGSEPLGQEVHTWGGWWYLVRPDGELIETGIAPETDG